MGPVRRGLILALLPGTAWAEVCDKVRPFWTPGTPATAVDEALHLAASPLTLVLLVGTALAVRFRSAWGGLAVVCCWSALVGLIAFVPGFFSSGVHQLGVQEGCIGSPALFIGVVAAICVATILYTAPNRRDPQA